MAKAPSDSADKFIIRLPPGMREQIAAAAKTNNRTMNAEVVLRLQASFDRFPDSVERAIDKLEQEQAELRQQIEALSFVMEELREMKRAQTQPTTRHPRKPR